MRSALLFSMWIILMFFGGLKGFTDPEENLTQQQNISVPKHLRVWTPMDAQLPEMKEVVVVLPDVFPPFTGSKVVGFKEALAFKESGGNYFTINTLGYLGKYQFGATTLETVGVYDHGLFLNNPQLQETVFYTNLSRNKWILRKDIKRFVGTYIGGIEITESGILAAAHLAGPGNVKRYLRSFGTSDVADAYGTRLSDYLKRFSGYDMSEIQAKRNPRLKTKTS